MEFRKLIKFGKNSHVISIPKSWLEKNKLNKGDTVYLDENSEGLVVSPKDIKEKKELKEITINTTGRTIDELRRRITAAYIDNFHIIKIIGKDFTEKSKELRENLHNLIALEIMEQTPERMVAKDFLKMNEVSIKDIIRRMDIIARTMIHDSKLTLKQDLYQEIYGRDKDVNRLAFLLQKTIKYLLENPQRESPKSIRLLDYWQMGINMETIADESKRIARFLSKFGRTKSKEILGKQLIHIYERIEKHYLDVMKAYYTKDKESAYKLACVKVKLLEDCNEFFNKNYDKLWVPNVIDKFKSIISYIHNLARIVYTQSNHFRMIKK